MKKVVKIGKILYFSATGASIAIGVLITIVFALLCMIALGVFADKAKNYTEEEHFQRVSQLVEQRYFGETVDFDTFDFDPSVWEYYYGINISDLRFESYEIHPVYNENDELKYFVVDFLPMGCIFVEINKETLLWGPGPSMYSRIVLDPWARCELSDNLATAPTEEDYTYEKDENGDLIYQTTSPYKVAGVENQRLYLLKGKDSGQYICAVKNNDKYLNLISMEEFTYESLQTREYVPYVIVAFIYSYEADL